MDRRDEPAREIASIEAGFYKIRKVRKGPFVAACIFIEGGVWGVLVNGEEIGDRTENPFLNTSISWVAERGTVISESDYTDMLGAALYAIKHAPDRPEAHPDEAIDLGVLPSVF